jgi:hypothetical protein
MKLSFLAGAMPFLSEVRQYAFAKAGTWHPE